MILGRSSFVYRIINSNTFVSFDKRKEYKTTKMHVDVDFVQNDVLDVKKFKNWRAEFADAKFILNDNKEYLCGFEIEKMSKSKYNTQTPDNLITQLGADTLRMYEMFLGPIEQFKPWDTKGINGVHNFLKKFWKLTHNENNDFVVSEETPSKQEYRHLHICIKKISEDLERFSFNTVVSNLMICLNHLIDLKCNKREIIHDFVILLSPYAPYISEEIWESLGNKNSISYASWPNFISEYVADDLITYPISFNGKMRFTINFPRNLSKEDIQSAVVENPKTINYLNNLPIKKIIIVPNKIINIVF